MPRKVWVAITDAGDAIATNGIGVQLDAQEVADLKEIALGARASLWTSLRNAKREGQS